MTGKVVAIIQARMGATRLPGKVLKPLGGTTVLGQVLRRMKQCQDVDTVVVATTDGDIDDCVVKEAEKHGVSVFRGSETDVLERYYCAAKANNADVVIRVTADCPLIDPVLLSDMLRVFKERRATGKRIDYLSNTLTRTYPRGLDIEIMTFKALAKAYEEATGPDEREHVTPYIWKNRHIFSVDQVTDRKDYSVYRWTLDTEDDYKFLCAVFAELGMGNESFSMDKVLMLLEERPDLVNINAHVQQESITA